MEKNRINYKKLILKKALAVVLSTSIGFSLVSDIGVNSILISKIKNNNVEQPTYSDSNYNELDDKFNSTIEDNKTEIDTNFNVNEKTKEDKDITEEKEVTKMDDTTIIKEEKEEKVSEKLQEEDETIIVEEDTSDNEYEYVINNYLEKKFSTASDGCLCIQGACFAGDSIIVARKRFDADKTYLYKINKDTYEIEKIVNSNYLGHCNDMAYNSDNNCIFIVGKNNYKDVVILDANSLETIVEFESQHKYFALAYDESSQGYVAFGGKKMYILNKYFEEINSFDIPTNLTKQGITVKDGLIYYLCWEKGVVSKNQTSVDIKRANTNYIFVYDMEGNLKTTYYLPNLKGEGEAIMFDDNGKLLVSVNGVLLSDWFFYSVDIDKENCISKNKLSK